MPVPDRSKNRPTFEKDNNMLKKLLAVAVLISGIAGSVSWYRDSRIGYIEGEVLTSEEVSKIFEEAVSRRFDLTLATLVLPNGQTVALKYKVPIHSGGPVDRHFFAPSVKEVGKLITKFKDKMEYVPEVYDCDDFSRHFKDRLMRQWAKERNRSPLAVVEVYAAIYLPQTNEVVYHAFNAFITSEKRVVFVEPQGPHAIGFSKARILAIYYAGI